MLVEAKRYDNQFSIITVIRNTRSGLLFVYNKNETMHANSDGTTGFLEQIHFSTILIYK